jgi:hypothetical protein
MTEPVNVGTVGHIDHRKILVVGGNSRIKPVLAIALAASLMPGMRLPSLPKPKPLPVLTQADFDGMDAAEAKRRRRINRNKEPRHEHG